MSNGVHAAASGGLAAFLMNQELSELDEWVQMLNKSALISEWKFT